MEEQSWGPFALVNLVNNRAVDVDLHGLELLDGKFRCFVVQHRSPGFPPLGWVHKLDVVRLAQGGDS